MPTVSIIVPCLNEERTIAKLLAAIYAQDFPRADLEVIITDAQSTDGTRAAIAAFQSAHPDLAIKLIENPRRLIPAGLNIAIAAAQGTTILRLDAHCIPQLDYISRSLVGLDAGRGWVVGGVWDLQPGNPGWLAESIAIAAGHLLGAGDALYRLGGTARAVDTVPFGAFRKDLVSKLGGFNESLHANEDYEFNTRVRQAGGVIWLDPAIRSTYFARPTLGELARQYFRYGYWKWRMLRRYPGSLRLRQALPPLFVLSLLVLPIASLFWPGFLWLLLCELAAYALLLLSAGLIESLKAKQIKYLLGIPLAIATMHLSWGLGFLGSLVSPSSSKANS